MTSPLRIGTRESALALWQAKTLQNKLTDIGIPTELVPIKSEGDLNLTQPLYAMGITGIFTKTLDAALLDKKIDIAIHSMKDVPTLLPKGIRQAAVLERGPTGDVMVWKNRLSKDKGHKTIATGSLRRKGQWLTHYPQDQVVPLRGNIQTRLKKLKDEAWDGVIFAEAALSRLKITHEIIEPLTTMLPAAAQGALMVVCRENEETLWTQINRLNHKMSALCTKIERDFLNALEGGCTAPIGALANFTSDRIDFSGGLYSLKGSPPQEINACFSCDKADEMGRLLARKLLDQGGRELMNEFKHLT
ncbi:MAG: hydroxymethylbilane synthase [Flavobacteriaceae bacterium]